MGARNTMSGFFADGDLTPNRIELARQRVAAGTGYIDLTSSNPTHQGLIFPADLLRAAADRYLSTRGYRRLLCRAYTAARAHARRYLHHRQHQRGVWATIRTAD